MQYGPDPNAIHPNENIKSLCYLKNVVTRATIIVGEYTYYDDPNGAERFEEHVTHHYEFNGDRLIIGKFCAIAAGIEFIMNGANHRMNSVTTYPFNIMGHGWECSTPAMSDLPLKGDTVVGKPAATVITSSPRRICLSPRSGDVRAMNARRLAEEPEFTRLQKRIPRYLANSSSNCCVDLPEVSQNSRALSTRFVISWLSYTLDA